MARILCLWPWHRPAITAPIRPIAWETPYAMGAALEKAKKEDTHTKKEYIAKYLPLLSF